jgi:hypothetical protein
MPLPRAAVAPGLRVRVSFQWRAKGIAVTTDLTLALSSRMDGVARRLGAHLTCPLVCGKECGWDLWHEGVRLGSRTRVRDTPLTHGALLEARPLQTLCSSHVLATRLLIDRWPLYWNAVQRYIRGSTVVFDARWAAHFPEFEEVVGKGQTSPNVLLRCLSSTAPFVLCIGGASPPTMTRWPARRSPDGLYRASPYKRRGGLPLWCAGMTLDIELAPQDMNVEIKARFLVFSFLWWHSRARRLWVQGKDAVQSFKQRPHSGATWRRVREKTQP